jgi:hypothetical protein
MSQLSSEKFLMSSAKTISGRCRLVGVTVSCNDYDGRIFRGTSLAHRTLSFRDGSSTASELFKFSLPVGGDSGYGSGVRPFQFMLGSNRILFENGIYLAAAHDGTNSIKDETQVIVYYEAG